VGVRVPARCDGTGSTRGGTKRYVRRVVFVLPRPALERLCAAVEREAAVFIVRFVFFAFDATAPFARTGA
jgi:hypothetical protein